MQIRLDPLTGPEIRALLEEHLRSMRAISPPESVHALDLDSLRQPDILVWTIWDRSNLLGCGALRQLDDTHAEIKSMRTAEAYRRRGVARKMLNHLLAHARRVGLTRLSLETGSQPAFEPARQLYRSFGFQTCGPFGDYQPDPNSVFMTLEIARARAALAPQSHGDPPGAKPPSEHTRALNQAAREQLPADGDRRAGQARRGFIGSIENLSISRPSGGTPLWSLRNYAFLQAEQAPDSVHPGLWEHARLNLANGLFEVTERVYQVRGFDISNMTIVEGENGLIVIDPLGSAQVARAALELYYRHRPRRRVNTVIYTHSHADHFGGVRGVVDEERVKSGAVQVIAPMGFMLEVMNDSVLPGNVVARRSLFQLGTMLPRGPLGQVDAGPGKALADGTVGLIPPTMVISREVQGMRLDDIDCVFELTPGAQAPAHLIVHFPRLRMLNVGELASHHMHSLLPLRGAQVRDALAWSRYLDGALRRYGDQTDVLVMQHHWPVWGKAEIRGFLERQTDLYRFIHDQTLRLLNHGHGPDEIAGMLRLPAALRGDADAREVYGTLRDNVRAVCQRYLGRGDVHPARLDPPAPAESARKTIEYMGGAQAVLERARADHARGEYRWVAQVTTQLLQADPSSTEARALCADALEQLGYQAESAAWRNACLQGALELREGPPSLPGTRGPARPDLLRAMPLDQYFDVLAMRLDGMEAERRLGERVLQLNWSFTDEEEDFLVTVRRGALTHQPEMQSALADANLILTRAVLDRITLGEQTFQAAIQGGQIQVTGSMAAVMDFLGLLDGFDRGFPVMEPPRAD